MAQAVATPAAPVDDLGVLSRIIPEREDQQDWYVSHQTRASDTEALVTHYVHRHSLRMLRLDERGRVYGQDPEGVVRLFGRGGPLALHVALNMVFDGIEDRRPKKVVLPRR